MSKFYGKIFCEEGVVAEREFLTVKEAEAYCQAFHDTREALDIEDDDFYSACVDTKPSLDEDGPKPREPGA